MGTCDGWGGGGACIGVVCHWVVLQFFLVWLGNVGLGGEKVGGRIV